MGKRSRGLLGSGLGISNDTYDHAIDQSEQP